MKKIVDFDLEKFYYEKINDPNIQYLDPDLITAFKSAKKKLNIDSWQRIKTKFVEKLAFVFSLDEEMCLFILAAYFQDEILDKDDEFILGICSFLSSIQISPFSYVELTKPFLKEPIYSICASWQDSEWPFYPYELYTELKSQAKSLEEQNNLFLKMIANYYQKDFQILFSKKDDLYTMYLKIKEVMEKANEKMLYFIRSDFEALSVLKQIIDTNNEFEKRSVKIQLEMIEQSCNTKIDIVKSILLFLKSYGELKRPKLTLLRTQKKQD